ncbi:hypothetical protein LTR29_015784 [Friedmanniomyces endolithicus]|nr:hypothetical protein LTR29_015784 [Friedmanniomyces endolithicus]
MPEPQGYRDRDLSLPSHRVPFWAQQPKSLQIWLDNPRKKTDFTLVDYFESFSYLPAHLDAWAAPAGLLESLLGGDDGMRGIAETTRDWQKAAAALATALERTEEFGRGARAAAYPHGIPFHHPDQPISVPSAETTRSNADPFAKLPPSALSHQTIALQRVRGFAGRIDVLLREEEEEERRMRGSGVAVGVFKVGVREYAEWWAVMRERAEGLGERVRGLETPRLGEVMAAAMAEGR